MVSPIVSKFLETDSQEKAIGKRVWDVGKSERRSVMERIGVQNLP
jgi:hypothetical protein